MTSTDIALVAVAFTFGFAATRVRLPAMVGYLIAGFVLHLGGFTSTPAIEVLSELGVQLLLFGIGLKLRLATLARPEVWGTGTIGVAATTALIGGLLWALAVAGFPLAVDLGVDEALLLGFAFSFSSTVFAVQTLERKNESGSLAGRIAVGVLIVQDVLAVLYLTLASQDTPTVWAIPTVVVVLGLRPVYGWVLARAGHGELLILWGFVLALGVGAGTFDAVGLKPDLGALLVGLSLSTHARSAELAERLLQFKDLFLVGFFLSIGLAAAPPMGAFALAAVLTVALVIKTIGAMGTLLWFRLRSRTALHTSVVLSSYSEFGLIVAAAAVSNGALSQDAAAVVALAVAASFVVASAANADRYRLYAAISRYVTRLERTPLLPEDAIVDCGYADAIVFGMGRVGTGAYDEICERLGPVVVGVDRREATVAEHERQGRRVVRGDALDRDFWERIRFRDVELVVAAMDSHDSNLECIRRAREFLPDARIAAIATYADQVAELQEAEVDVARNLYEEAGQGLADDALTAVWRPDPTLGARRER